jgi:hypothetical protein
MIERENRREKFERRGRVGQYLEHRVRKGEEASVSGCVPHSGEEAQRLQQMNPPTNNGTVGTRARASLCLHPDFQQEYLGTS